MPINYDRYPPDWFDTIRPAALKRANYKCEVCGVPNRIRIVRDHAENWLRVDSLIEQEAARTNQKIVRVVLTVSHVNHIPMDCRPENLRVLCQLHHLRYDAPMKAIQRKLHSSISDQDLIGLLSNTDEPTYCGLAHSRIAALTRQLAQLRSILEPRIKALYHSEYDESIKHRIAQLSHLQNSLRDALRKNLNKSTPPETTEEIILAALQPDRIIPS